MPIVDKSLRSRYFMIKIESKLFFLDNLSIFAQNFKNILSLLSNVTISEKSLKEKRKLLSVTIIGKGH